MSNAALRLSEAFMAFQGLVLILSVAGCAIAARGGKNGR